MPLVSEVKISLLHTHNAISAETLRMPRIDNEGRPSWVTVFLDCMCDMVLPPLQPLTCQKAIRLPEECESKRSRNYPIGGLKHPPYILLNV
ncbi:hypothetical protein TNCV_4997101 [Trichonephila clavipes]|nr:hypothetical protein TNCV_4997101 [Trichonephila clavipes]